MCFGQVVLVRHRSQDGRGHKMTYVKKAMSHLSFFRGPLTLSAYSTGLSQPTGCLPFSKGHQTCYQIVLVLSFVKAITVFCKEENKG